VDDEKVKIEDDVEEPEEDGKEPGDDGEESGEDVEVRPEWRAGIAKVPGSSLGCNYTSTEM